MSFEAPLRRASGSSISGVERNAYGRQIDSRVTSVTPEADFQSAPGQGTWKPSSSGPIIRRVGEQARVLARYQGDPVLSRRAGTWSPRSIRSVSQIGAFQRAFFYKSWI